MRRPPVVATVVVAGLKRDTLSISCVGYSGDKTLMAQRWETFVTTAARYTKVGWDSVKFATTSALTSTALGKSKLGHFKELLHLNVQNNAITSVERGSFDAMTLLLYLDLEGNSIASLPDGVFDKNTKLRRLNLEYNLLTKISSGLLSKLTALEDLRLDRNPLSAVGADFIANQKQLHAYLCFPRYKSNLSCKKTLTRVGPPNAQWRDRTENGDANCNTAQQMLFGTDRTEAAIYQATHQDDDPNSYLHWRLDLDTCFCQTAGHCLVRTNATIECVSCDLTTTTDAAPTTTTTTTLFTCGPGTRVVFAGRECAACDEGTTWQDGTDQRSCRAVGTCVAGTYLAQKATVSRDSRCEPCPAGQFTASADRASCTEHLAGCGAGKHTIAAPTPTSQRMCAATTDCAAGSYVTKEPAKTTVSCSTGFAEECLYEWAQGDKTAGTMCAARYHIDCSSCTFCGSGAGGLCGTHTCGASGHEACAPCRRERAEACADTNPSCAASASLCTSPSLIAHMRTACRKTCKVCGAAAAAATTTTTPEPTVARYDLVGEGGCEDADGKVPVYFFSASNEAQEPKTPAWCEQHCSALEGCVAYYHTSGPSINRCRLYGNALRGATAPREFFVTTSGGGSDDITQAPVPPADGNYRVCYRKKTAAAVVKARSTTSDRECGKCADLGGVFSDTTNAKQCTPYTTCKPGSYVAADANLKLANADRTCKPCRGALFSSKANSASCLAPKNCRAGSEYVAKQPSPSSDRVCATCADGTTSAATNAASCSKCKPGTAGAGGICAPCDLGKTFDGGGGAKRCSATKICPPGTRQAAAPTLTSDRVCESCAAGTSWQSGTNEPTCKPVAICQPGTFLASKATATQNVQCTPCAAGTFSVSPNQLRCDEHKESCGKLKHTIAAPTATSQRKCARTTVCKAGFRVTKEPASAPEGLCGTHTCGVGGHEECAPCRRQRDDSRDASSGFKYVVARRGAAAGTDPICADINPNCAATIKSVPGSCSHSSLAHMNVLCRKSCKLCGTTAGGASEPQQTDRECAKCPAETFSAAENSPVCAPWRTCAPGQHVRFTAGPTEDRRCTDCPVGTFSGVANAAACQPHTVCKTGTFVATLPTPNSDRACQQCADGSTTAAANAGPCQPCAPGSAGAGGACTPCVSGTTFQDQPGQLQCFPVSDCSPGTRMVTDATPAAPRKCEPCQTGEFQDQPNMAACRAVARCLQSTFVQRQATSSADVVCAPCPPDTFSDSIDQGRCKAHLATCPDGEHTVAAPTPSTDRVCSKTTTCVPGQREISGSTAVSDRTCSACPAGTFSTSQNAAGCAAWDVCAPGEHVSVEGTPSQNRVCQACQTGTFAAAANEAKCTTHATCEAGSTVTVEPTPTSDRACKVCPDGSHTTGSNQVVDPLGSCEPCPSGTAGTAGRCTPCSSGTTYSASGEHSCSPVRDCGAGYRQTAQPTATSDRECAPCTLGEGWQDTPNQAQCRPVSECKAGTHVARNATATSDIECAVCAAGTFSGSANAATCAPHAVCSAGGLFQATAPSATSDRMCAEVGGCGAGQHVLNEATASTNRVCATCVGETYSNGTNAPSCSPFTACEPGEFVALAGAAAWDRVCRSCEGGTFSTTGNAGACSPWDTCPAGEYVSTEPSASSQRECGACPVGTFTPGENAATCTNHTACFAGHRVATKPTATVDRVCERCADGASFSVAGNSLACSPVADCGAGEFEETSPTATSNRQCAPCGEGTFSGAGVGALNPPACTPWTICPAGTHVAGAPQPAASASVDRVCTACPSMHYSVGDTNAGRCEPITPCTAGTYVASGATASSDNECEPCATFGAVAARPSSSNATSGVGSDDATEFGPVALDGGDGTPTYFTASSNEQTCRPHRDCQLGTYELDAATPSSDRVCPRCPNGTFTDARNQPSCAPQPVCTAGQFVAAAAAAHQRRTCSPCPEGTFSTDINAATCVAALDCRPGEFVDREPSVRQDRSCRPVRLGVEFTSVMNQVVPTAVADCDAGFYVAADWTSTQGRVCTACPAGQFSAVVRAPTTPVFHISPWPLVRSGFSRVPGFWDGSWCGAAHSTQRGFVSLFCARACARARARARA